MQLRHKFRLYPSVHREQSLAQAFGCARVVYNDALAARNRAFAEGLRLSDAELCRARG